MFSIFKKPFSETLEGNRDLAELKARREGVGSSIEMVEEQLLDLDRQINSAASDVRRMADAIAAGETVVKPVAIAELRAQKESVTAHLSALTLAAEKLDKTIESHLSDISAAYAKTVAGEQKELANRIIDSLLTIAEANQDHRSTIEKAESEGCKAHHFANISFVIKGCPATGSFHDEKSFLSQLFIHYEQIGFAPTGKQNERLAALV